MKKSFHRLLFKQGGNRATWEYPFAVAGINISFMLIQMLDLYAGQYTLFCRKSWDRALWYLKAVFYLSAKEEYIYVNNVKCE